MDVRMVIALNMYDELERHGNKFDHNSLSRMIGTPIVPTISKTGFGIEELFNRVIKVYDCLLYTSFFREFGAIQTPFFTITKGKLSLLNRACLKIGRIINR